MFKGLSNEVNNTNLFGRWESDFNAVVPDPGCFFFYWVAAAVADIAAVNPNDIKTLLANGVRTLFIIGRQLSLMA